MNDIKEKQRCCMCLKKLIELESGYVCLDPKCPNYSLLQVCEDDMIKLEQSQIGENK